MFSFILIEKKPCKRVIIKGLTLALYYQGKLLTTIMSQSVSADFFNYAHSINPKIKIYNLSLMSFVMSGNIETAISTVIKHNKNLATN